MRALSALRLSKLRHILSQEKISGFIITKKENIYYLTGEYQIHPNNRESILFVSPQKALLYHSPFNHPKSSSSIQTLPMSPSANLSKTLNSFFNDISAIAIEGHDLTVNELDRYKNILPHHRFVHKIDLVESLRLSKDSNEIKLIKRSSQITSDCMHWVIKYIHSHAGKITEIELARKIETKLKQLGADNLAFPVIVAADKNSASPHHQPGSTRINNNSVVLIDFGSKYKGYCSDMTRTIMLGKPSQEFKRIKNIVDTAYSRVVSIFSPDSCSASKLDLAARDYISSHGYAKNFIHTTGHGIGLEIHEIPSLNAKNQDAIRSNMIFTIEPGIYIRDKFGYRFENTVLTNKDELVSLTN